MSKLRFKHQRIMSHRVFSGKLSDIDVNPTNQVVINTLNPHSYVIAKKDKYFSEALNDSDIVLADGIGIVLAAKLINKIKIKKISGADLQDHLLFLLNQDSGSVFYVGSTSATLSSIKSKIRENFPNIKVGTYAPPFKPVFSKNDNDLIIEQVNSFSPDVLFIGMTAPKQEKWLYQNKNRLNFRLASCIGAAFDFYAGTITRPSPFWINLGLEWFVRLIKEPRRLFHRNFVSTPLFLLDVVLRRLRGNQ